MSFFVVEKHILSFEHVRLLLSKLFVFLVSRQPFDSLFQRMFQNVPIPEGRCARKEKSQRQFSYANHITLFSLIPPEHCKLLVQNLKRERERWKERGKNLFQYIYQCLNVQKNYDSLKRRAVWRFDGLCCNTKAWQCHFTVKVFNCVIGLNYFWTVTSCNV